MLKGITFDFWNTLFRDTSQTERNKLRKDALRDVFCGKYGLPKDAVFSAYEEIYGYFDKIYTSESRTPTCREMISYLEDQLKQSLSDGEREYLRLSLEEAVLEIPPELVQGIKEAVPKAAGKYKLGIISDTGFSPGRVLRKLLEKEGLVGYFDLFAFSDELGRSKPHFSIFEFARKGLSLEAPEIMHIGDTEWTDIKGANQAGFQSALFIGVRDKYLQNTSAKYIFRTWYDFIELIS